MSRSLDKPQLDTFIEVGSVYLTDLLIEKAAEPHDQSFYPSYHFLKMVDLVSDGKWLQIVGQEKMLELTNLLCDQLTSQFKRYGDMEKIIVPYY